jgi:hypothetical protein
MITISYYSRMIAIIAFALLMFGCASRAVSPSRAEQGVPVYQDDDGAAFSHIGVLEPEMLLYDVSAGGIHEYRDDWSEGASRRLAVSAAVKIVSMGYEAVVLPDVLGERDFFKLKTKMRYHGSAFQSAFFAKTDVLSGMGAPEFSVGPLDGLCDTYGVDGFLYVYGFQEKFSEERQVVVKEPERTFVVAILVGRDGRVSWYRHLMVSGNLNIRADNDAMRLMGAMFE